MALLTPRMPLGGLPCQWLGSAWLRDKSCRFEPPTGLYGRPRQGRSFFLAPRGKNGLDVPCNLLVAELRLCLRLRSTDRLFATGFPRFNPFAGCRFALLVCHQKSLQPVTPTVTLRWNWSLTVVRPPFSTEEWVTSRLRRPPRTSTGLLPKFNSYAVDLGS